MNSKERITGLLLALDTKKRLMATQDKLIKAGMFVSNKFEWGGMKLGGMKLGIPTTHVFPNDYGGQVVSIHEFLQDSNAKASLFCKILNDDVWPKNLSSSWSVWPSEKVSARFGCDQPIWKGQYQELNLSATINLNKIIVSKEPQYYSMTIYFWGAPKDQSMELVRIEPVD